MRRFFIFLFLLLIIFSSQTNVSFASSNRGEKWDIYSFNYRFVNGSKPVVVDINGWSNSLSYNIGARVYVWGESQKRYLLMDSKYIRKENISAPPIENPTIELGLGAYADEPISNLALKICVGYIGSYTNPDLMCEEIGEPVIDPGNPPGGGGSGDFTIRLQNGSLRWSASEAGGYGTYYIYKDGVKVGEASRFESQDQVSFYAEQFGSGSYKVVAIDHEGNPAGESDMVYFDGGDGGGNPDPPDPWDPEDPRDPNGECSFCDNLGSLLECPHWDDVMSDLERAIRRAIPPPPDWDQVARTMRDTIVPAITNDLLNRVVPEIGNEIDRRFGRANYDGNTGIREPSLSTPWESKDSLPTMQDLDREIEFNINESGKVPVFEVEDMTPTGEEMIIIPDMMNWDNPASESRPSPKFEAPTRETNPNEDNQTKETEPSGEIGNPRDTTPSQGVPRDPGGKPTDPGEGESSLRPRDTTPRGSEESNDDESNGKPSDPAPGRGRDTVPEDWNNR